MLRGKAGSGPSDAPPGVRLPCDPGARVCCAREPMRGRRRIYAMEALKCGPGQMYKRGCAVCDGPLRWRLGSANR